MTGGERSWRIHWAKQVWRGCFACLRVCRKFHFVSHFVLKSLIVIFFIAFKPNYTNIIFSCTMGIETLRSEWKLNEIKEKSSCKNSLIIRHRTQGNTPTHTRAPMFRFIVLQAHIPLASLQIDWFSQGQLPHGLGQRRTANGSAPASYLKRCFTIQNRRGPMKQSWLTGIESPSLGDFTAILVRHGGMHLMYGLP